MPGREETRAVGMGCPVPIFAARDLEAAMAFYGARAPSSSLLELSEVYVATDQVGAPHAEWQTCGLLPVPGIIGAELKAEVRRRWDAGEPVGLGGRRIAA